MDAVALIVMDVETFPNSIPLNTVSISFSDDIDTPTFPTSPSACAASGS